MPKSSVFILILELLILPKEKNVLKLVLLYPIHISKLLKSFSSFHLSMLRKHKLSEVGINLSSLFGPFSGL